MARTIIGNDWLAPFLCGILASAPVLADVSPVTSMGAPAMVVPQFQETGAPTFKSPNGSTMFSGSTTTGSTTGDSTSSDPTSSSSSGGGSVATNYS